MKISYYGSRSNSATFKAKDLGDDPPPQYKVGPLFCFCSIVIVQKTYYEMDFKTTGQFQRDEQKYLQIQIDLTTKLKI